MQIKYICPYWGSEHKTASVFLESVVKEGYDGIEINLPEDPVFLKEFFKGLNNIREQRPDFVFIAQSVPDAVQETAAGHIKRVKKRLETLASYGPCFINSHTGKDHFSFDDNCRIIAAIEEIALGTGTRIQHETHRGRFSFHACSLLPYLERFPQMELVADYSHWCNVSESLLADQAHILQQVLPRVSHIHARIGQEQAPQVNDPFAPEWNRHLEVFTGWWKDILKYRQGKATAGFTTITPEFGPAPYMPSLPFTQQPVGNQWHINAKMKDYLKTRL